MTETPPERPPFPDLIAPPYGLLPPAEATPPPQPLWQRLGRRHKAAILTAGVAAIAVAVLGSGFGEASPPRPKDPQVGYIIPTPPPGILPPSKPEVLLELYQQSLLAVDVDTKITAENVGLFFRQIEAKPGALTGPKLYEAKAVVGKYVARPIPANVLLTTDYFVSEPRDRTPPPVSVPGPYHRTEVVTNRWDESWCYPQNQDGTYQKAVLCGRTNRSPQPPPPQPPPLQQQLQQLGQQQPQPLQQQLYLPQPLAAIHPPRPIANLAAPPPHR